MQDSAGFVIRDAGTADLDAVLHLNRAWEHVTSPLSASDLTRLHHQAALHRVVERDCAPVAFLLAFAPRAVYESPNYRWFDGRGDGFLYIDRVVVSSSQQRAGLGAALYQDAIDFARACRVQRV